jgi:CHAD domain-containing protein
VRPVKAARVRLPADSTIGGAFALLADNCAEQMQANEAGLCAGRNPEYLHQFRVALRRLRSLYRIYRPLLADADHAALATELSWLSALLGATRDWDVFLRETLAPLRREKPDAIGLDSLRRRCLAQRRRHAAAMRRAFASDRYAALRDAVLRGAAVSASIGVASARWTCAQPAKAFAATRIAKLEKKVQQLAGGPHATDSTHRHRLRIAVKRLRYAIDFFRALFDAAGVRAYGSALAAVQDSLGTLNDCVTARRLLDDVGPGRDVLAHAQALECVLEWLSARERAHLLMLDSKCAEWRAQKPFW